MHRDLARSASPLPTGRTGRGDRAPPAPDRELGQALAPARRAVERANTMPIWLAICTAGSVPGVRSQMRSAVARAAAGRRRGSPRRGGVLRHGSAVGPVGRRAREQPSIVAASWSGRSSSSGPGATSRVPRGERRERVRWSSAATWATIPPTPMPARCAGRSSSWRASAAASAARSRSVYAGASGSTVVDAPESRRSYRTTWRPPRASASQSASGQESMVVPPAAERAAPAPRRSARPRA